MSEDEEIAQSVAVSGWHVIDVYDHAPPFVYTCGLLTTFKHPEAIILGLDPQAAYGILSAMVEDIRGGRSFATPGTYEAVLLDLPMAIKAVHPSQHELYLGYAMGHCRHTGNPGGLVAVQVLWPDKRGRFPFESECDAEFAALQPRLDLPAPESELRVFRRQFGT